MYMLIKEKYSKYLDERSTELVVTLKKSLKFLQELKTLPLPGDVRISSLFRFNVNELKESLPRVLQLSMSLFASIFTLERLSVITDLRIKDAWRKYGKESYINTQVDNTKIIMAMDFPKMGTIEINRIADIWERATIDKGGAVDFFLSNTPKDNPNITDKSIEELKEPINMKEFVNSPPVLTSLNFRIPEEELKPILLKMIRDEPTTILELENNVKSQYFQILCLNRAGLLEPFNFPKTFTNSIFTLYKVTITLIF